MLILLTSPSAMLLNGALDSRLVQVLIKTKQAGNPVGIISNHAQPDWFENTFSAHGVNFINESGRQSGGIVSHNAKHFNLKPFDVLVLAVKDEDIQMGKNGGAVLVAAGWSSSLQVRSLGICVHSAQELSEVIALTASWTGDWWFKASGPTYKVLALADLSGYGKDDAQQVFGRKLTATVKGGGARLNALLAVTARSLLMIGLGDTKDLVWGVYPSSSSDNSDDEVLSDFVHRLRTTVSRVRYASRGEPLFIRHTASPKRSKGGGGDRSDPANQIQTIHLNPFYKASGRLVNKIVVVLDDCTTYGVSFGVAAAFLKAAGAREVYGVALGKFGDRLDCYDIEIRTDPFSPVGNGFLYRSHQKFSGDINNIAQEALQRLIP
jgi:hypothetical protein